MDKIEIKKGVFEFEVGQEEVVGEIYINGKSLIEILRHEELPYLHPGESESVAGSYSFLRAGFVMMILTEGDGYGTTILDCPCGTYGCFNLDIKIEETDDRVYWYDFYQGFRPWYLYDNIAYFEFDKAQYYREIEKLRKIAKQADYKAVKYRYKLQKRLQLRKTAKKNS